MQKRLPKTPPNEPPTWAPCELHFHMWLQQSCSHTKHTDPNKVLPAHAEMPTKSAAVKAARMPSRSNQPWICGKAVGQAGGQPGALSTQQEGPQAAPLGGAEL